MKHGDDLEIPLRDLIYDFHPAGPNYNTLKGFYDKFLELENNYPSIDNDPFVMKYYPKLLEVVKSVKEVGVLNPLIVFRTDSPIFKYATLIGNQRLFALRVSNHNELIKCKLCTDSKPGLFTKQFPMNPVIGFDIV